MCSMHPIFRLFVSRGIPRVDSLVGFCVFPYYIYDFVSYFKIFLMVLMLFCMIYIVKWQLNYLVLIFQLHFPSSCLLFLTPIPLHFYDFRNLLHNIGQREWTKQVQAREELELGPQQPPLQPQRRSRRLFYSVLIMMSITLLTISLVWSIVLGYSYFSSFFVIIVIMYTLSHPVEVSSLYLNHQLIYIVFELTLQPFFFC